MIPLYTPAQVRQMDERTIASGTAAGMLMERAAAHLARAVVAQADHTYGLRVLAVCGKGNNAGDGIAAARRLRALGCDARVHLVTGSDGLSPEAADQLRRYLAAGGRLESGLRLEGVDVIVDCLLGTGSTGAPREPVAGAIGAINGYRESTAGAGGVPAVRVVACDVPSGVDADTGQIAGQAVGADVTVVIGAAKRGLWISPARGRCGELRVVDIGLDAGGGDPLAHVLEPSDVLDALPPLRGEVDKRERGSIMLVAGSAGMAGAAIMAARGALGMGVGLLTIAIPAPLRDVVAPQVPEAMTLGLPQHDPDAAFEMIDERLQGGTQAVGIGPGLGRDDATQALVHRLVREATVPIVLDADGLNAFRHDGDRLAARKAMRDLVITPHRREYARLLGKDPDDVWADRITNVGEVARRWGATVVLKGPGTIVEEPPGATYVNPTGNAALATGGTGDVLTGMLTAALPSGARGTAVAATVYVHGLAGEIAAQRATSRSVTAMDVARAIPAALARLGVA